MVNCRYPPYVNIIKNSDITTNKIFFADTVSNFIQYQWSIDFLKGDFDYHFNSGNYNLDMVNSIDLSKSTPKRTDNKWTLFFS